MPRASTARPVAPPGIESPWVAERAGAGARRDLKRESMLRAAARLFAERGVDRVSMDDVAAALGVAKPTVYRTVGDKDSLVKACELRMVEGFRDAVDEAARVRGSGLERIRHYLRRSLELSVEDDFCRLMFVLSNHDVYSLGSSGTRAMREDIEARIREWIALDQGAGRVRPEVDPKVATLALFASFNFIPRWYRPGGSLGLDEIFGLTWAVFAEGLGAPATRPAPSRARTPRPR